MVTVKIEIKPHLVEYILGKYNGCEPGAVRFPDKIDLYHTIYDFLEKRPSNVSKDDGNLEIILPERSSGKKTSSFNYLGVRSVKIVEKKILVLFWAEVHDFLDEQKHRRGIEYKVAVYSFVRKYNITSIDEGTLLKNYYRWRENIRKRNKRRKYQKSE